jgi:hypothetical protein
MTWFRVDDTWHDHPKVISCSLAARGLWLTAGTWCARHATDGAVPAAVVLREPAGKRLAAELVAARLWDKTEAGWLFRGWLEYQPSRGQLEAEREATRARVAAWRVRCNGVTSTVTPTVTASAQTQEKRPHKRNSNAVGTPAPSRPVPLSTISEASAIRPPPVEARATPPAAATPVGQVIAGDTYAAQTWLSGVLGPALASLGSPVVRPPSTHRGGLHELSAALSSEGSDRVLEALLAEARRVQSGDLRPAIWAGILRGSGIGAALDSLASTSQDPRWSGYVLDGDSQ